MIDAEGLARQVRDNCEVCNARFAGGYSLCGLLLRLRNLYKWEQGLPPWEEPDPAAALEWVAAREEAWEALAEEEFRPLRLGGASLDPLDAEAVNVRLRGSGLIYGAGLGWGLRPSFFLGELAGRRRVGGRTVHIVGRELARDLFSAPALLSGERVVVRRQAASYHLWDRLRDIKKSGQSALLFALTAYGLKGGELTAAALSSAFPRILEEELACWVRHELGELEGEGFPREVWRAIIARFPGERVELVARALKDALADCGPRGMLAYIIRLKRSGSLGFYVAFLDGVRRLVLSALPAAFEAFCAGGDWAALGRARQAAFDSASALAGTLVEVFSRLEEVGEEETRAEIERRVMAPLGL